MSLKILCAGCAPDERTRAEAEVDAAMATLAAADDWTVSLVKMGARWSVTIDGPEDGPRGVTLSTQQGAIGDAIREALGAAPGGPTPTSLEDQHTCPRCYRPLTLSYEALPEEPRLETRLTCPRCWTVMRLPVAQAASRGRHFKVS